MKAKTAKDIYQAFEGARDNSDALTALQQACGPRRAEIRERLLQIESQPDQDPPERAAALDPEAARALDVEAEDLRRELHHLDRLEGEIVAARETAITGEIRRAIPAAVKKLPTAVKQVRTAIAAYDEAIAALNSLVETLAEYPRLADKKLPLADDELAELFELRDAIWQRRDVRILQPLTEADFPRSWWMFYEQREDTLRVRRQGPWLLDYVTEPAVTDRVY